MPIPKKNDFEIDDIAKIGKHEQDIGDLTKRIQFLEAKFGSNEKIADTLCETNEKAVKFSEMFEQRFIKLLQADGNSKKYIRTIVADELKQNWKTFALSTGGKIAFAIWTVGTIVLGAWLGHIWK